MNLKEKGQQPESRNPNFKSYDKDTKFITQQKRIYSLLLHSKKPLTALQVHKVTGIRIQNITRAVGKLKDQDKIIVAKLGICPLSKYSNVQFLTVKM